MNNWMKYWIAGATCLIANAASANSLQADAFNTLPSAEKAVITQQLADAEHGNVYRWWAGIDTAQALDGVSLRVNERSSVVQFEQVSLNMPTNCYLLMVDTSGSMQADWSHVKQAFATWVGALPASPGLYGFASGFNPIVPIAQPVSKKALLAKVDAIALTGKDTQLYLGVNEALAQAQTCPASRKHLVIFSDGDAEDKAYTLNDVVSAATAQAVTIHTVGFGDLSKPQTALKLEVLKALSSKTGGLYQHFEQAAALEANIKAELALHTLAGLVRVSAESLPYGTDELLLDVTLVDEAGVKSTLSTPVPVSDTQRFANVLVSISEQFNGANPWLVIGGFGFSLLILLLLLMALRRNKEKKRAALAAEKQAAAEAERALQQKQHEKVEAAIGAVMDKVDAFNPTDAVVAKGKPYGWLRDQSGHDYDLVNYSSTIGRSDENDVMINDAAVSYKHAILDFKNGEFIWTDRVPTNKTKVNNQEINGSQKIMPGDMIECGQTTLEFMLA